MVNQFALELHMTTNENKCEHSVLSPEKLRILQRERGIKFIGLFGDRGHRVHIVHVIITYTLEKLSSLT